MENGVEDRLEKESDGSLQSMHILLMKLVTLKERRQCQKVTHIYNSYSFSRGGWLHFVKYLVILKEKISTHNTSVPI